MIRILSISGCARVKPIKSLATDLCCPFMEINQLKFFLEPEENREELDAIAKFYGVSLEKLLNTPSLLSRPLILIPKEEDLTEEEKLFLAQLRLKDYMPNCIRRCSKEAVCPARDLPIDILVVPARHDDMENEHSIGKS